MSRDQIDPRHPNSTGRPEEYIFDPRGLIDPAPGCTKELEAETGERTLWGDGWSSPWAMEKNNLVV